MHSLWKGKRKCILAATLEKAYDKVPRHVMWWALEKHKVPTKYITLIKDVQGCDDVCPDM